MDKKELPEENQKLLDRTIKIEELAEQVLELKQTLIDLDFKRNRNRE